MGSKTQPGAFNCYQSALPDEPIFTLLARDPTAPDVIRTWSRQRRDDIFKGPDAGAFSDAQTDDLRKATEAEAVADEMTVWRRANEGVWRNPEMRINQTRFATEHWETIEEGATKAIGQLSGIPSQYHSGFKVSKRRARKVLSPHFPIMELSLLVEDAGERFAGWLNWDLTHSAFSFRDFQLVDCRIEDANAGSVNLVILVLAQ